MTYTGILGHKHANKHSIKNAFYALPLGLALIISSIASPVLAFEPSFSPTPQMVADLNAMKVALPETVPAYSYTDGSALASASPITDEGTWPVTTTPKRVARVRAVKPTLDAPVVLEGQASYYSRAGCLGCDSRFIMANGEPLNDNALTMAIGADKKHLVGYQAKVTNLATGLSTVVRITDTGGFYQDKYGNRVADLSVATKQAIGMGGLGQVRVEVF